MGKHNFKLEFGFEFQLFAHQSRRLNRKGKLIITTIIIPLTYSTFVRRCQFSRERIRTCFGNSNTDSGNNSVALLVHNRKCHKINSIQKKKIEIQMKFTAFIHTIPKEKMVSHTLMADGRTVICYTPKRRKKKTDRIEIVINSH